MQQSCINNYSEVCVSLGRLCARIWFGLHAGAHHMWWFGHQSDASDADNLIIHYKKNNEVGAHSMNILFICIPLSLVRSRRVCISFVCVVYNLMVCEWVPLSFLFSAECMCILWLLLLRGVKFYLFRSSATSKNGKSVSNCACCDVVLQNGVMLQHHSVLCSLLLDYSKTR